MDATQPLDQEQVQENENENQAEETAEQAARPSVTNPCSSCDGAGLQGDPAGKNKICSDCQGSGVQQDPVSEWPEGTQVIRADGVYKVIEGRLTRVETS